MSKIMEKIWKMASVLALLLSPVSALAQDGEMLKPQEGQTATSVLSQIQKHVNGITTLKATLELDRKDQDGKKKKKKKGVESQGQGEFAGWEPEGRKVKRGPIEISRGSGARVKLQRKKSTDEYIANGSTLWSYDHGDDEARYISTSLPVISTFVAAAFKLDVFSAMDQDTIKFRGTQVVEGEPCWVLEGASPSKLELVGLGSTKMKIWVSQKDGIPRLIRVPDADDAYLRLKSIHLNEPIESTRFNWSPPKGVDAKNIFGF